MDMQPWLFHAVLEHLYTDVVPSVLLTPASIAGLKERAAAEDSEDIDDTGVDGHGVSATDALQHAVEVAAAVLDAATMFLTVELRTTVVSQLVLLIGRTTAPRLAVLGGLFSSVRLLDAATDYINENLLIVGANPMHLRWLRRRVASSSQDSPPSPPPPLLRPGFGEWLDEPLNSEVALHLAREIIERHTAEDFEDVIGRGGPLRAAAGQAHSAELLPKLLDGSPGVAEFTGITVRLSVVVEAVIKEELATWEDDRAA